MRALDKKLLRDLWHLRGQAIAIALVIASGIATFVMFLSCYHSLEQTRRDYYRDYRFADVFVSLKRAPESLVQRLIAIPGVLSAETRVVGEVNLSVRDFPEPVSGRLISLPDDTVEMHNRLYLRTGRLVDPLRDNEVVIGDKFAKAHRLTLNDTLKAVIRGHRKVLMIVGIAQSPEYIYQLRPGSAFPDFKRYTVLWMARKVLENAYDMNGAFNDAVLGVAAGTSAGAVIERLDNLLARYGGVGAYARADQLSHRFLSEELKQLRRMAFIFPSIFIAVAAFLLNVVLSRLLTTQRDQIAILKAFGYTNRDLGGHYLKLVLVIALTGTLLGVGMGGWLGQLMSKVYIEIYSFPFLQYRLDKQAVASALLVSFTAALIGAGRGLLQAVRMPPAEAMRPEPPTLYRQTAMERLGMRWLSPPEKMILRHLTRWPFKTAMTIAGMALACGITMTGRFQNDVIAFMMRVEFGLSQREDLAVNFIEPSSRQAYFSLLRMPGVRYGELVRVVPVRLRAGPKSFRTIIKGMESGGDIQRLIDVNLHPLTLPDTGIVLTDYLGAHLGVRPGDTISVEILEGRRSIRQVPIAGLVSHYIGVAGYMQLPALNRLLQESDVITSVHVAIDAEQSHAIYQRLLNMPRVASVVIRKNERQSFYELTAATMLFFMLIATLFASVIAFGVIYNSARIAFTERSRELASMRVLGFTRNEIAYILLGELAVVTLLAIPIGLAMGYGLGYYIARMSATELYRIPYLVEPNTYAFAATVVLAAAMLSGLILWRRLQHLDLIAVLKERE